MHASSTETKTKSTTQTSTPWNVIIFDDPVNLMDYVTLVITKIFGYPKTKAETLMRQIHEQGKSIVWTGEKEKAELYVQQLHSHQLQASLQKSE